MFIKLPSSFASHSSSAVILGHWKTQNKMFDTVVTKEECTYILRMTGISSGFAGTI